MINRPLISSLVVCLIAYATALAAAAWFINLFERAVDIFWLTFMADVVATFIIFLFSVGFRNASLYDPYWSIAPFIIALYWNAASADRYGIRSNLLIAAFFIWGVRLTLNWLRGWKGLKHEDWRYGALKKQTGKLYPLVNLTGIHLFPTLIVFAAMLPAFYTLTRTASNDVTILVWVAFLVCVTGTWLEFIADEQQRTFKRLHPDRSNFCRSGVWAWSRHPNYLGEVMFWWGIYFFVIASNPAYWWTVIGAVAMTLMFIFISIPMMEKRMTETRPLYVHYQKEVPAFFPAIKKMVSVVHQ